MRRVDLTVSSPVLALCIALLAGACKERPPVRATAAGRPPAAGAPSSGATASRGVVEPAAPSGEPAGSFPEPQRPVADIVAPRWTNEDSRDDAGEFARVASVARVVAGTHVADIGAGDGYYAVRLAPLVQGTGRVYAEDIVPDYLTLLRDRVQRERLTNVQVSRGDAHDPRLPAGVLDVALMIHMYHEIDQPFGLLWNLAASLKAGGRIVILDLDRPTFGHGTPPALLRCELTAVGYREVSFTRTGEEYIAVFESPGAAARPTPAAITSRLAVKPCLAPRE